MSDKWRVALTGLCEEAELRRAIKKRQQLAEASRKTIRCPVCRQSTLHMRGFDQEGRRSWICSRCKISSKQAYRMGYR